MELAEALVQSIYADDVASLQLCMQQCAVSGLPMDFVTEGGVTLLMHAITAAGTKPHPQGQYTDTVMLLIQAGVPLDAIDEVYGRTAAHWAAHYNQYELLDIVMVAGCDMMVGDLQGMPAFHLAVSSGSVESVQIVLQRLGAEMVETRTVEGLTPLMTAAQTGQTQVAQVLIQSGCDINALEDALARTAMHIAAENGNAEIVELLLKYEAVLDSPDMRGLTPIHIAGSLDTKEVLAAICNLVGNEVLDIPDASGMTSLLHACRAGWEETVKFIIKKKVNFLAKDLEDGKTCMHWATESGSPSAGNIVKKLIRKSKALLEEKDNFGRTPLLTAAAAGNAEVVQVLLTSGCNTKAVDVEENTALHLASSRCQPEVTAVLLQHGFSGLEKDKNGATPLHHASHSSALPSEESVDPVLMTISQGALECIKVLLEKGVSHECTDNNGMQPIHWALQCSNNTEAIHLLISYGSDPNSQDSTGMRGLHIAAKYGVTDGCQYLVEVAGVNGNVLDNFEQTAIFYSIESQSLLCSEYLLSIGCSANHRNKDQRSPVHIAASVGSVEGIELLLARGGGDASLKSIHNTTPLHDAAAQGHTDVLQYILASAYDPNAQSEGGIASPLHFAVSGGNKDCVQLLLEAGAKINAVMVTEEEVVLSPLDYAADNEEIQQLLLSYGALPGSELKAPTPPAVTMETASEQDIIISEPAIEEPDAGEPDEGEDKERPSRPSSRPLVRRDRKLDLFSDEGQQTRPASGENFPPKRANLLSRALTVLKKKPPPQDSILSSVVGFYGAQATMLAASVIATPLGAKAMEISEKVATDSAEELKKFSADFDGSLPNLEWLQTPAREPTPTPEPPTPPTPTPPPPPSPPPVEIVMEPYERRLRKAKAQMDQTKSVAYQAVDELLKAQKTHTQLKRQFAVAKLKEDLNKKRQVFENYEEEAKAESQKLMDKYQDRMKKAENSSLVVTSDINEQIESAHNQNSQLASTMGKMGLSSRPTVSEWLQRKQEDKRVQLKDTLVGWSRTKQQRDTAIYMQQAVTTRRVMRHAAWGMKKSLSAQLQALERQELAVHASLESKGFQVSSRRQNSVPVPTRTATHQPVTAETSAGRYPARKRVPNKVTSTGCIRATPAGFLKMRDMESPLPNLSHRQRSTSLPDSTLWDMGASYIDGKMKFPRASMNHRAYGPKTIHAERTLCFLPPQEYEELRKSRRSTAARDRKPDQRDNTTQNTNSALQKIFSQTTDYHTLGNSTSWRRNKPAAQRGNSLPSVLPMTVLDHPHKATTPLVTT